MMKKIIYLALLGLILTSCESTDDSTKNQATNISNETILETKEIHPVLVKSQTSKMEAYVYLTSEYGSDRIVFDTALSSGNKLVLRMQSDGNLCLNVVKINTQNQIQPVELQFVWGAFNYAHPIGSYQLVNDSNGNMAIFKDYSSPNRLCIWTTNTEVSPDFESQHLIVEIYRRNSALGIAEQRTYARLKLVRKYPGGEYQGAKTICDEIIGY